MENKELEKKATQIRRDIVLMLQESKSGHPGGSLSSTEIMVALYFSVLKHDPQKPNWIERDRFILSKGHSCPVQYACLARAGYFNREELFTLRKLNSRLQGHPGKDKKLPGIEVSSGSLGQGLSISVGNALGFKLDNKLQRVYCLMGDGELDEGQIWEAAMAGAHYRLNNLCAVVDNNGLQIDGCLKEVMNIEPLREKWNSFGWNTIEIDGHKMQEILNAFKAAQEEKNKPTVIIAHTIKGKGISFMENVAGWHGKAPSKEETDRALKELV
ncbi:transketolase [bacterium]|nr:transketolase [bacterium]